MVITWRQVLIFISIIALLSCNVMANNSRPPRTNDNANLADALKYLQDLDSYYGDRSRPRFGKRSAGMQFLRNHVIYEGEMNPPYDAADEPF